MLQCEFFLADFSFYYLLMSQIFSDKALGVSRSDTPAFGRGAGCKS
jgi:hypothetical protein